MSQSFRADDRLAAAGARLAALRAYLEPLAERRLLALAERAGPDEAWLQVTPANDQAAPMHIYLDRRSGYMALHAGRSFAVDDHYWDQFPAATVAAAVARGALREEIRLWGRREVGISGALPIPGEDRPIASNRTLRLGGELLRLIIGPARKRLVAYAPYDAPA